MVQSVSTLRGHFYDQLSFGGTLAVRCPEKRGVHFLEVPKLYYFYRKSNRGHRICPLYRGCLLLGESVSPINCMDFF